MQANNVWLMECPPAFRPATKTDDNQSDSLSMDSKLFNLNAVYRQLFKENRDLDFFRQPTLDSAYLNGNLTVRELVAKLLCSEMYVDYILSVNSNYRFVAICFERVLGRSATQAEIFTWSSLLAAEGLPAFVEQLTDSDEYMAAFGDEIVPYRRSQRLSTSNQGLPALAKEQSMERYQGKGNTMQHWPTPGMPISMAWQGSKPSEFVQALGAAVLLILALGALAIIPIAAGMS